MTVSKVTSKRRWNSASLVGGDGGVVEVALTTELLLLAVELEAEKTGLVELGCVTS